MVKVAWDTSNLVVLYDDTTKKAQTQCCGICGNVDCCCFLDPSTPTWDSGTTFAEDDLCEHSDHTYQSLQDNNINKQPDTEPAWWLERASVISCGNSTWDSVPPYGGIGKSPSTYTVTFGGLSDCGGEERCWPFDSACASPIDANGTYYLTQNQTPIRACRYYKETAIQGECVNPPNPTQANIILELTSDSKVSISFGAEGDKCGIAPARNLAFSGSAVSCTISGTMNNELDPCGSLRSAWEGGQASWRPGTIDPWSSAVSYIPPDQVAHLGAFYEATATSLNEEPPNASYWDIL